MPKTIDIDDKKEFILQAAIRVFARKGSANTKMADIAKEAGIGKGTIYEYFRSKDEVFSSTFNLFMQRLDEIMSAKLYRVMDPMEKLRNYMTCWMEILTSVYINHIEVVLDYWAEGIRHKDPAVSFDLATLYEENRMILKNILDDCIRKRAIKKVDSTITASVILGALDGLLIQWILDKQIFDIKKAVYSLTELVLDGLKK